jgi:DNA modification methylase
MAAAGRKEVRPGGLDFGPNSYRDRGGAMVTNLITTGPVGGNDPWRRALKAAGLPAHPCPMPLAVPSRVIAATTAAGDMVGDFGFGSGATGAAAEALGRRWVGVDHHRLYLEGAALRPEFTGAPGYQVLST